jgi:hypothetical protein
MNIAGVWYHKDGDATMHTILAVNVYDKLYPRGIDIEVSKQFALLRMVFISRVSVAE